MPISSRVPRDLLNIANSADWGDGWQGAGRTCQPMLGRVLPNAAGPPKAIMLFSLAGADTVRIEITKILKVRERL